MSSNKTERKDLDILTRLKIMVDCYDNPVKCEVADAMAVISAQRLVILDLQRALSARPELPSAELQGEPTASRKRIPTGYAYTTLQASSAKLGQVEFLLAPFTPIPSASCGNCSNLLKDSNPHD